LYQRFAMSLRRACDAPQPSIVEAPVFAFGSGSIDARAAASLTARAAATHARFAPRALTRLQIVQDDYTQWRTWLFSEVADPTKSWLNWYSHETNTLYKGCQPRKKVTALGRVGVLVDHHDGCTISAHAKGARWRTPHGVPELLRPPH
jgi:hypothetical protein